MAKFMNDDLRRIRDNLVCSSCRQKFIGSDSQAWKVKYEKGIVYCSKECRSAARKARIKPQPERGPCRQCGETFRSRYERPFCSMKCYMASDQFREMYRRNTNTPESIEKRAKAMRTGKMVKCLECKTKFYKKKAQSRKFCSSICFREYMNARFDRWVANPETIAEIQSYDGFMVRDELPCIVDGCSWSGNNLGLHVNLAHGITARQFKQLAGFNIKTGLVSKPLHLQLCEQNAGSGKRGVHLFASNNDKTRSKRSREGNEHAAKARALDTRVGPVRKCAGCGLEFNQRTVYGHAMFCTVDCREAYYKRQRPTSEPRQRNPDGTFK